MPQLWRKKPRLGVGGGATDRGGEAGERQGEEQTGTGGAEIAGEGKEGHVCEEGEPHKLESKSVKQETPTSLCFNCMSVTPQETQIHSTTRGTKQGCTLLCSKRMTLVRLISSSWQTYCSQ